MSSPVPASYVFVYYRVKKLKGFVEASLKLNFCGAIYDVLIRHKLVYLPNLVEHTPDKDSIRKADEPIVCFLGCMDPQKRYWLFFELAKNFSRC